MDVLAIFVTIVGLGAWMGSAIFVTFLALPLVSKRLNPSKVADISYHLANRYHWVAVTAASLMLIGAAGALFKASIRVPTVVFIGLTALAVGTTLYGWLVLLPRAESLRERLQSSAGTEANFLLRERYDQAERLAIFGMVTTLALLLGAAFALAAIVGLGGGEVVAPGDPTLLPGGVQPGTGGLPGGGAGLPVPPAGGGGAAPVAPSGG